MDAAVHALAGRLSSAQVDFSDIEPGLLRELMSDVWPRAGVAAATARLTSATEEIGAQTPARSS